mmetsp:Transcript_64817/g.167310  ORF Transcript_64817/g.167310 Transcript_64817/m.167310 type:complete len:393 (+) Transcript_64817:94-1272(+)
MADDMNRDEVDKCKKIAETALANGDADKATRFLQKAKRMSPGDASIDALLASAVEAPAAGTGGGATPSNSSAGNQSSESSGPRYRTNAAPSAGAPTGAGAGAARTGKDGRPYTAEQMQLVQRILRTKDYYAILELEKNGATEEHVKKAYKKLALKLHPDKNKAPGAEEAFKKLSKAVQCLTDSDKKHVYDQYGDEERVPQQHRHHQQDFMTPEDLFAAFFGGAVHQAGGNRGGHQQQQQQGGEQQFQGAHLLQMLPVLLLILLTLVSNFGSSSGTSRFSFTANHQYKHERSSAAMEVNYFVSDDFADHYAEGTQRLAEFEKQVEIYHVRNLHSECDYQEKTMYKKVMIAKRRGSQEELAKARRHPKPACKEIDTIKKSHSSIYRAAMYMGVY